jgi:hypothetical protein
LLAHPRSRKIMKNLGPGLPRAVSPPDRKAPKPHVEKTRKITEISQKRREKGGGWLADVCVLHAVEWLLERALPR